MTSGLGVRLHSAARRQPQPLRDRGAKDQPAVAFLLRRFADRLDEGSARPVARPSHSTVLDAEADGLRCVLLYVGPSHPELSPRELEIARMVARGCTNRAIASALDISLWTVSSYLRRAFAKLNVNSRAEMVATLFGPAGFSERAWTTSRTLHSRHDGHPVSPTPTGECHGCISRGSNR